MTNSCALTTMLEQNGMTPQRVTPDAERVRFVRLGDQSGPVNVMVGANSLLDLDELERFSGRQLLAASKPDIDAISTLSDPATILLADRRLFEDRVLVLTDDENNAEIGILGTQLHTLVMRHDLCSGSFGAPLDDIKRRCNDADLDIDNINSAVSRFTTRRIKQRIEDTLDFPPLPEIANRIVKIGSNSNSTVSDLARVVELDPSLSAQVVSWASSPYYAAPGKVSSIDDAILRVLGFDLVMNLALGLAIGKTMKMPKDGPNGYRSFWVQAVDGAAVMESLIKSMPVNQRPQLGTGYLVGLLHNFGLLVLSELMRPQLKRIFEFVQANSHCGHPAVERHLLGATREQMAALLMRFWNLPEEVCAAIRHQHSPDYNGEHVDMARLLFVTTRLLGTAGVGSSPREEIPAEICESLGIELSAAHEIGQRVLNPDGELKSIAKSLAA